MTNVRTKPNGMIHDTSTKELLPEMPFGLMIITLSNAQSSIG
jgi:hypothetical protein